MSGAAVHEWRTEHTVGDVAELGDTKEVDEVLANRRADKLRVELFMAFSTMLSMIVPKSEQTSATPLTLRLPR